MLPTFHMCLLARAGVVLSVPFRLYMVRKGGKDGERSIPPAVVKIYHRH